MIDIRVPTDGSPISSSSTQYIDELRERLVHIEDLVIQITKASPEFQLKKYASRRLDFQKALDRGDYYTALILLESGLTDHAELLQVLEKTTRKLEEK